MLRRLWWLWLFGIAVLCELLAGSVPVEMMERRVYDSTLSAARSPGWDGVVIVSIDRDYPSDAAALARVVGRLSILGTRTIGLDKVFPPEDPGLDDLLPYCDKLVLPAVPFPGSRSDGPGFAAHTVEPDEAFRRGPVHLLSVFRGPPPGLAANCPVGLAVRTLDSDTVVRRDHPLVRLHGDGRVMPSLSLVTFVRHRGMYVREADLFADRIELPGTTIELDGDSAVLVDWRSFESPPTITPRELFEEGNEAALRLLLQGGVAFILLEDELDFMILPGARTAPGGLLHAFTYRRFQLGVPLRLPSWPPLAVVTLLSLALVRWRPRATPVAVFVAGALVVAASLAASIALFDGMGLYLPVVPIGLFVLLAGVVLGLLSAGGVTTRLQRAEARADAAVAPKGRIALVFTDVQGSTRLWEKAPTVMRSALQLHNDLFRRFLEELGGYEVKTEGDAFMVAFQDPVAAVRWCLDVQRSLVSLSWPPELTEHDDAREVRDEHGGVAFRGLRVRMGVHVGEPQEVPDPKSGRMDYFGPVVNRAARVSGAAHGGQILLSGEAWKEVESRLVSLGLVRTRDLGMHLLKGLDDPERLVEILPEAFRGRQFAAPKTESATAG